MRARPLALLALLTAGLAGCTRGDPAATPRVEADPRTDLDPALAPLAPLAPTSADPPDLAPLPGTTIHQVSLSLVVRDPGQALDDAQQLLRKLGGEVSYASANGDNASLNGRVPVDARHQLRDALVELAGEIQSENMSTSDIGYDVRRLRRRLVSLQAADSQVAGMMAGNDDPTRIEAAALLRELTERERQSIEAQLQSYAIQTRDGQVSVSFTRPVPAH